VKILDRYILTSFVSTLLTVFVILYFIFILQGIWLFITELAGKDLDFFVIVQFLLFYSPKMVPLVLPLSVLLASIMTFGNFAEHYEFGAINIKVDKKSGEKGQYLDNVTMHIKSSSGYDNKAVIRSTDGELESDETSNILKLHLFDGNYYEDVTPKSSSQMRRYPFVQTSFEKYTMNIDLNDLQEEGDSEKITNTYHMLNASELLYTIDSLETSLSKEKKSNTANLQVRYSNIYTPYSPNSTAKDENLEERVEAPKVELGKDIISEFKPFSQTRILQSAVDYTNSLMFNVESNDASAFNQIRKINDHYLAFYGKFVVAYSCFLMYFIGAPLGSIIRKGGLGLPIVFAVIIFIIYHFVNTFGQKLAQEDGILPILGAWSGAIVLTPLAVFLTIKATKDNGEVNFLSFFSSIGDFFVNLFKHKDKEEEIAKENE